MSNDVRLAVNICTYKRKLDINKNINLLLTSKFFDENEEDFFGKMEIFIVDNAAELVIPQIKDNVLVHLIPNRNTGGSGGFQRGIEEIRKYDYFTHVIFMDDDVSFELSCFYILYDFLRTVDNSNADRPVAGRMLDKDNPNIQWTAAERWNGGNIEHVEFLRDITDASNPYVPGRVVYDTDADYGGWWFCCYPYSFVKDNDVMPFFLHCDDVEYGLRCGKSPIIIEGVHVWHETWEKKMSPTMLYYDMRNTLFVNEMYGLNSSLDGMLKAWKDKITAYHVKKEWLLEYMVIIGMRDYLKGQSWIERINSEKHHNRLRQIRSCKLKNALSWRRVEYIFYKELNGKYVNNELLKTLKGLRVYLKIRKSNPDIDTICINQHPAIGDAFISNLYLSHIDNKENYLITCISKSSQEIYESSGFKKFFFLSQNETNELISYCHFMGLEMPEIWILHHQALEWKTGIAWLMQGINNSNFHDLIQAMVFPEYEKAKWKPLINTVGNNNPQLKENSVIIFPYANTLYEPNNSLWESIVTNLLDKGYMVYTHVYAYEKTICGTKEIRSSIVDLVNLVNNAVGLIAIRNGLVDVIAGADCKKIVLYPNHGAESWICGKILDYWSIKNMGFSQDAVELEFDEEWKCIDDDEILHQAIDKVFPRLAIMDKV